VQVRLDNQGRQEDSYLEHQALQDKDYLQWVRCKPELVLDVCGFS
jgi:hypothetical protein